MINELLNKIENKNNLTEKESEEIFTAIMSGNMDTDKIVDFLVSLAKKGETIDEITGAARVMRKLSLKINADSKDLLDTCGTGGDSSNTFNISTVSAFVASGAGCRVAKHGNRAVSSKCGSANLLEALGVKIDTDKEKVEECINKIGIGFLFAPKFHTAMKNAMPARQKIKKRSIFNILGPLTNPAGAKFQLIGVYDKDIVETVANVLNNLGSEHALVVHGKDGLDEITTCDVTFVAELKDKSIKKYTIEPETFGITRTDKKNLQGGDVDLNKKIGEAILRGKKGPMRDIVLLNAGASIYVSGVAGSIKEGIVLAAKSLDSGKALSKLEDLIRITNN